MQSVRSAFRRRSFLQAGVGILASALGVTRTALAADPPPGASRAGASGAGGFLPVVAPDLGKLPFEWDNGVKVFRLVAEPLKQEVLPGKVFDLWGYNGSAPGPTIEVVEGDRVRILFENRLPEGTTVHWHGLEVPIEMDGVPAISQPDGGARRRASPTSSPCGSTARSSTTRTAPCRR